MQCPDMKFGCVLFDLDLQDTTFYQGHDTPFGQ